MSRSPRHNEEDVVVLSHTILAEMGAARGELEDGKLGDFSERKVLPPGWRPLSEAAAAFVVAGYTFRLWANCRWMADADVTVEEVTGAWRRQKEREVDRYQHAMALYFVSDAGAYKREERRCDVLLAALTTYPQVWPLIADLLKDDDYTTWDARLASEMDKWYSGWRDLPLFFSHKGGFLDRKEGQRAGHRS